MIRVGIVAPAIAVRAGLKALLIAEPGIQVIAEAASLSDLEDGDVEADVLVWSPGALPAHGPLFPEELGQKPRETTALLLIYDDPMSIERLRKINLRAWGLLSPESSQGELIAAVYALNEGLVVTNPLWMQYISAGQAGEEEDDVMVEALTGRELEILQLLALGLTNKQIALKLGISAHTVKFHVSSIFSKMRTTNRTETVKLGLRKGLILL